MKKILCGVDIGGTKLSTALITEDGKIMDKNMVYDHIDKPEDIFVEQLVLNIKSLFYKNGLDEYDIAGIGIGCAGHMRFRDGVVITTSNLKGFKNFPLRDAIQEHFKIPVILDNDANAQAFGEYKFGAGQGYDSMIFLTISTGIGAGIIINGKLFRGQTGTAGEFGHTIVNPDKDLVCTCGNQGCLMSCACGLALPHLFENKIKSGNKTQLELPDDFDFSQVDGKLLKKGLDMKDKVSTDIVLECGEYIGIGLYNIFQVFNPPTIILGGGLLSWGPIYMDKIKETFYRLARDMIFDPINIETTKIGVDAGLIGAASLVLE